MRNYNDKEYAKFRKEVRARDKATCQFPACKSKRKIQVHHIRRWANSPSLRYKASNGICLCKEHHTYVTGKENIYASTFQRIALANSKESKNE
jgi:5-methylcytosine-specific restriction endonuclease McrA